MNVVSCCAFYISLMALIMVKALEVIVFPPFTGLYLRLPWGGVCGDLTNRPILVLPTLFSSIAGRGIVPTASNRAAPCELCYSQLTC